MDLAPEFLNGIIATGEKIAFWAQSVSEELVRDLDSTSVAERSYGLVMRISNFVAELHEKKKELGDLDTRIRRVYDQIQPTQGHPEISHLLVIEEKFRALDLLVTFSKKLDNIILAWESFLYAVENRHVSLEKAYAIYSVKLTNSSIEIITGLPNKHIPSVASIAQQQDSQTQVEPEKFLTRWRNINPSQANLQMDLETKDKTSYTSPVDSENPVLINPTFFGITKSQWALIAALGMGVILIYCGLLLLTLRAFIF